MIMYTNNSLGIKLYKKNQSTSHDICDGMYKSEVVDLHERTIVQFVDEDDLCPLPFLSDQLFY